MQCYLLREKKTVTYSFTYEVRKMCDYEAYCKSFQRYSYAVQWQGF